MKKYLPYLIIALVCIIAFWQVAFLTQSLKYDILDGYLPGHYFLSECLRNNVFPLWNPYQQLGFPIYADMLNTNYLVDMFLGRLFPYTNITFHILFIIYIIIAGIGVYKLSNYLKISREFSLLAGIAYSLSGFVTGNAQHIQFIIGAAWLPLALLFFLKLSAQPGLKNTLLFVIFMILLITGGYPSFAIVLGYGLLLVYLYNLLHMLKNKKSKLAGVYTLYCSTAAILLIALCSGLFISMSQAFPYIERYRGITYGFAVTNPFTPTSLISLIAPLVTASHSELFHTDLSMNNHYFGVIILFFFIYGLFRKQNILSLALLSAGIVLLFFSFGEYSFVHRFFYHNIPLFDRFRHPSSFRFITILLFLLFTGLQVTRFSPTSNENFGVFKRVYLAFMGFILLVCLGSVSIIIGKITSHVDFKPDLTSMINDYGIYGPLLLQSTFILIINIPFVFLILYKQKIHWFYLAIGLMLIIETVIFTQVNMKYTVTSSYNPREIRNFLRERPAGFPLPDQNVIAKNTDISVAFVPVVNNTNTYSKTVSADVKYPFYLDGFKKLESDPGMYNQVINNKLLYFKESGKSGTDSIECIHLSPSGLTFKTKSDSAQFAILLQNYFPGWKATIDGQPTEIHTVYHSLMGISIPGGEHEVKFEYRNHIYINAVVFSFALFAVLLLLVIVLKTIEIRQPSIRMVFAATGLLIIVVLILLLLPRIPFEKIQQQNNIKINSQMEGLKISKKDFILLNVESPIPFDSILNGKNSTFKRFRLTSDGKDLWEILDTLTAKRLIYVWSNVLEPPEIQEIIQMHYPVMKQHSFGERYKVIEFLRDSGDHERNKLRYLNNFEATVPYWIINGSILDSIYRFSGRYSEKLSTSREFSSTFRYTLDKLPPQGIKVFAAVQFQYDEDQQVNLVISVNRKGRAAHYYAVDLKQFHINKSGWNIGFASQQWLKSSLRKGDEIVVYCWNNGKNESVYLDDFLVTMD